MLNDREKLLEKLSIAEPVRRIYFSHPVDVKAIEYSRLIMVLSGHFSLKLYDGTQYFVACCQVGDAVFCLNGGVADNLYDSHFESAALVFSPEHVRIVYYQFTSNSIAPLRNPDLYYISTRPPGVALSNMVKAMSALGLEHHPEQLGVFPLAEAIKINAKSVLQIPEEEHQGKSFQTWQRINRFIATNPTGQKSRQLLARNLKLNAGYISTLCHEYTGKTLTEHLNIIKLQHVTLLLQETTLTLDEIAQECGFNYTSYLIKVYKKYYGCTPGQMRY
jgi:AraC-like DNA-binding protein